MRSCAQYRVPPLPYLTEVRRKVATGWPQDRLEELLPGQWQLVQEPYLRPHRQGLAPL
jgi:hypothetical protein